MTTRSRRPRPDACASATTVAVDHVDLAVPAGLGGGRARSLRAAASPRCCARSPGSSARPPASISYDGQRPRRHPDPQARLRADVPGRPALRAPRRRRATSPTRCGCATAAAPTSSAAGRASCSRWSASRGTPTGCPPPSPAGERQRVALARALAVEPRLLLLDEPLSALDRGLRERLAGELHDILRAAGATAMLVTHDHEEAFAVADRMAVMREGRIVQAGTLDEVWSGAGRRRGPPRFLGYATVLDRGAARPAARAGRAGPTAGSRSPCGARPCGSTRPAR